MARFEGLRNGLARARASKLSTRVTVLFVGAFILPWCAYGWLTATERAEQIVRAEHNLAALATAYGEHATTLMRLGIAVPMDNGASGPAASTERGRAEMAAFRGALNAPGVN